MTWESDVRPLDDNAIRSRWADLISDSSASPFDALAYHDAIVRATGYHAEILIARTHATDEAGMVVHWKRIGPYKRVVIPPFTPFTSFLSRHPFREADMHDRRSAFEVLLAALESRFDITHVHLPPAIADVRCCRWRGWSAAPLYTYVADLNRDPFEGWSKGTRRTFQSSSESYVMDIDGFPPSEAVRLLTNSLKRQNHRLPLQTNALNDLLARLQTAGLVSIYTARPDDSSRPEAAVAVLRNSNSAAYWLAGSTPGASMTVLLGKLLSDLREKGLSSFDFVGANTPQIAEFKRRFGPALTPYYRIGKISALLPRLFPTFRA